jgi:hypothetical protein
MLQVLRQSTESATFTTILEFLVSAERISTVKPQNIDIALCELDSSPSPAQPTKGSRLRRMSLTLQRDKFADWWSLTEKHVDPDGWTSLTIEKVTKQDFELVRELLRNEGASA